MNATIDEIRRLAEQYRIQRITKNRMLAALLNLCDTLQREAAPRPMEDAPRDGTVIILDIRPDDCAPYRGVSSFHEGHWMVLDDPSVTFIDEGIAGWWPINAVDHFDVDSKGTAE